MSKIPSAPSVPSAAPVTNDHNLGAKRLQPADDVRDNRYRPISSARARSYRPGVTAADDADDTPQTPAFVTGNRECKLAAPDSESHGSLISRHSASSELIRGKSDEWKFHDVRPSQQP